MHQKKGAAEKKLRTGFTSERPTSVKPLTLTELPKLWLLSKLQQHSQCDFFVLINIMIFIIISQRLEGCDNHSLICMTDSTIMQVLQSDDLSTCVEKCKRASDTLWRTGRPFPFPESPFTIILTPPSPLPPPSESDDGEWRTEVSVSISLTHGGLRSTWKSAEILQLLETSKSARLMKNGSTWSQKRESVYNLFTYEISTQIW